MQVFQSFYEALAQYGIKPGEFTVLRVIGLNPGTRQGMIARALKIKPAHMTKLIQRMAEAGYVKRTVPPNDRRSVTLALTVVVQGFITKHAALLTQFELKERAGLSDTEYSQFTGLLQRFIGQGNAR